MGKLRCIRRNSIGTHCLVALLTLMWIVKVHRRYAFFKVATSHTGHSEYTTLFSAYWKNFTIIVNAHAGTCSISFKIGALCFSKLQWRHKSFPAPPLSAGLVSRQFTEFWAGKFTEWEPRLDRARTWAAVLVGFAPVVRRSIR